MDAIEVKNIYKGYGNLSVLKNLNMTVQRGTIYGLLGASGCGKTTLLSCIIGMLPADSGAIRVLGERVVDNQIPTVANRIGFLPQETSLVSELTVKETLYFFGNIYQYDKDKLNGRYEMLRKLFELPPDDRRVEQCSGGQRRRISFASALIHEPNLVILDEPTVGLDPILREKTWKFLLDISRNSNTTVVVTTHYIEEACNSDRCGLMRNGILLEEAPPHEITSKHGSVSLEDAFVKLCLLQETSQNTKSLEIIQEANPAQPDSLDYSEDFKTLPNSFQKRKFFIRQTLQAMIFKNFLMILRQPMGFLNMMFCNLINIVVFYLAIGNIPTGINIAIVNEEMPHFNLCQNSSLITTFANNYTCDLNKISCRFLDELSEDLYNKKYYHKFDDAYHDALEGKMFAIIYFARNFTDSTQAVWRGEVDDEFSSVLEFAEIKVYMDKSDFQLRVFFEQQIRASYDTYSRKMLGDCKYSMKLDSTPIHMEKPIYGKLQSDFKLMMAPSILMIMMFFQSMIANITIITDDRSNGIWNRILLSGVAKIEYIITHVVMMTLFNVFQLIQIVWFMQLILTSDFESIMLISSFLFCLSFSGMFIAFAMGCILQDQNKCFYALHGCAIAIMILSGLIWPVEGLPWMIKMFVYFSPVYIPSLSARDVIIKGYGIFDYSVYSGFIYVTVWMMLSFALTMAVLKKNGFSRNM